MVVLELLLDYFLEDMPHPSILLPLPDLQNRRPKLLKGIILKVLIDKSAHLPLHLRQNTLLALHNLLVCITFSNF